MITSRAAETARSGPSEEAVVVRREDEPSRTPVLSEDECWCGGQLPPPSKRFSLGPVPESLTGLLVARWFCSAECSTAFLLDVMHLLESPRSPDLISDVHSVYCYLLDLLSRAERIRRPRTPSAEPLRAVVPGVTPFEIDATELRDAIASGQSAGLPRLRPRTPRRMIERPF
jgi:hypothetical protein